MQKRLVILVPFLLLLAGCAGLIGGAGTPGQNEGAFAGGTQALQLGFLEGEPPEKVLDNGQETFMITLLLRNEGEYTIPKGKILATLSGASREAFNLKSLTVKSDFDLEKKAKSRDQVTQGGQEELSFGVAKYKPDLPADFGLDLRADVCYDYQTEAVTSICLKKNAFARADVNDNCALDNPSPPVENSGGPLQVSSVKQRPTGANKIRLSFDVSNKGVGAVYPPGTFASQCGGSQETEQQQDSLQVSLTSTGNKYPIACSKFANGNHGTVRLVNGVKTINCEIDTSGLQDSSFTDFLIIKMKYMYRDAVSVPLTIENSDF